MAVDVFISYARPDRERIETLALALDRAGYSVWWDHGLAGGASFAAEIERALNEARAIVVAWSVVGVQSDWVLDEAGVGKDSGKLIPIRLDHTPPPLGFRQYHVIDFTDWMGEKGSPPILALTQSIDRIARRSEVTPPPDGSASPPISKAIAVLPFENFIGDASQQYFVDGVHEAVITELSKIGELKVISRTSTRTYSESAKSIREIAAELGVTNVVEGSVARQGDLTRISIQLIDARSDTTIFADSFEHGVDDLLRLQQEVARAIARAISGTLTPQDEARLTGAPRVQPKAHEAYLKGMYHWYRVTPEDLHDAIRCFEMALAEDPEYAPAHAGIAAAWAGIQQMGVERPRVAGPRIQRAVEKAILFDGDLAQAHFTNGVFQTWSAWRWADAEASFLRAIQLNPNFPDAHAYFAHYLNIVGRFGEAEPHAERALDLDPFNPLIRALYAVDLQFWGRHDEAIEQVNMVLAAAPDHWLAYQIVRYSYHHKRMFDEALAATRSLYTTLRNPDVVEALDRGFDKGGYRGAMKFAAEALATQAQTGFVSPVQIAILFGMADEPDLTATWIEEAFETGDPDLPYLKHHPRTPDWIINLPRVQNVISRLSYPQIDQAS